MLLHLVKKWAHFAFPAQAVGKEFTRLLEGLRFDVLQLHPTVHEPALSASFTATLFEELAR